MTNDEDISERSYRESVRYNAQRIAQKLVESSEAEIDAWDDCWEIASNSRWVCSTYRAKCVLGWSKNCDAIFDEFGTGEATSMAQLLEQAAHCAMARDLMDAVTAMLDEQDGPSHDWLLRYGGRA